MAMHQWIGLLQSQMKQVPGIIQVYTWEDLPGAIGAFPSMIILPMESDFDYGLHGTNTADHELQATLYVASQSSPEAYKTAVPFTERVRDKLAESMTLNYGEVVASILPSDNAPFSDGPGGIRYAGKQHLGIIFRWHLKEVTGLYTAFK